MASAVIYAMRSTVGQQPNMPRILEKAAQTFVLGVPVMVDTTVGAIKEWDGTTVAQGIAGFCKEAASNLTTTGVPKTLTFGSVPNQPNAQNIPMGAPINDGRIAVETSNEESIFFAQVGPAQTVAVTDLLKQYGMTKDSDGHWYVDKTKTTVGTNTVVQIVKLDPIDTIRGVQIVVTQAAAQMFE
jgi:hypothetical protein